MNAADTAAKVRYLRRFVRFLDGTVNFTVLVALLFLLCCGCYSLWDSKQIYRSASSAEYEIYKPNEESSLSFEELRRLNADVFGWLTVYGTAIDYPLLQGEDNWEYLNKSCEGKYSLTGSIFLDYRNAKDMSDYNSVIHGHHMAESAMFGDLDKFNDPVFFSEHEYGSIYYGGSSHGLVFFAYLVADAYDGDIYRIISAESEKRQEYLDMLTQKAKNSRDCGQSEAEHIVLLSTCSSDMTNGRSILAGYVSEELYEDPFYDDGGEAADTEQVFELGAGAEAKHLPLWGRLLILLIFLILVYAVSDMISARIRTKKGYIKSCKKEGNTHEEYS